MTDDYINYGETCKVPLIEYQAKARNALNFLENELGSHAMDTEYAKVNGYLQGYIAAVNRYLHIEDL